MWPPRKEVGSLKDNKLSEVDNGNCTGQHLGVSLVAFFAWVSALEWKCCHLKEGYLMKGASCELDAHKFWIQMINGFVTLLTLDLFE